MSYPFKMNSDNDQPKRIYKLQIQIQIDQSILGQSSLSFLTGLAQNLNPPTCKTLAQEPYKNEASVPRRLIPTSPISHFAVSFSFT